MIWWKYGGEFDGNTKMQNFFRALTRLQEFDFAKARAHVVPSKWTGNNGVVGRVPREGGNQNEDDRKQANEFVRAGRKPAPKIQQRENDRKRDHRDELYVSISFLSRF